MRFELIDTVDGRNAFCDWLRLKHPEVIKAQVDILEIPEPVTLTYSDGREVTNTPQTMEWVGAMGEDHSRTVFVSGMNAYDRGAKRDENPHVGHTKREAWFSGWDSASKKTPRTAAIQTYAGNNYMIQSRNAVKMLLNAETKLRELGYVYNDASGCWEMPTTHDRPVAPSAGADIPPWLWPDQNDAGGSSDV